MKTTNYLWIIPLAGLVTLAGCSTTKSPPPAAATAPAAAPEQTASTKTSYLVDLVKNAPTTVAVGDQFTYELVATAHSAVSDVTIVDLMPAGLSVVSSDPEAARDGNKLVWKIDKMNPGEAKTIRVTVKADKEGNLESCSTVSASPSVCVTTLVGKPQLAIKKTGPEFAQIGQDVTYSVVVENSGNTTAKDVVVTDKVPDGMSSSTGQQELTFQVGDLAPAASKTISVPLKANQRGKFTNTAVASSSNAGKVSADAVTTVVQAGIKITKTTSDHDIFINRPAAYNLEVSNTGDTDLTGLVITDTAAAETIIATAEGASVSGTTATWNLDSLKVGEKKTYAIKIVSKVPGKFTDTAGVTTAQGVRDSAQEYTTWRGVTGVLVELLDDPDPIQVGETTKFTVRVTNQGSTVPISDLRIVISVPAELELVPGTLSDGGTLDGNKITWPVTQVPPKTTVTHTYIVKGVKTGDARTEASVTTLSRPAPINTVESTTVY
jgi:uncharacterized repeat protein (TIGR01451 family)